MLHSLGQRFVTTHWVLCAGMAGGLLGPGRGPGLRSEASVYWKRGGGAGLSFRGERKSSRNANIKERPRGRSLLHGHGTFSTSKVGGWRLAVGGWWGLAAICGWQLVVGGGWRLPVGGWWSLGAVLNGCP